MPESQAPFGQYILEDKIAQGGMAEIFRGRAIDATGIPKPVVIKKILPHIAASKEFVDMLVDEAKIAVMCQHGNIAQIYDLGRVGDDYFIVMEYVDGKTLSQIAKKCKALARPVPVSIAVWCAAEILAGLDYIHRKTDEQDRPLKIIHRDVSPQNVILSHAGTVKIVDFGIAKAKTKISTTDSGILKGKFAYMSPEQAEGDPLDHRSDIFSVGIILHEFLTGTRLFKGENNPETLKKVRRAHVDRPSQIRREIPRELDDIILKALAKDPGQRFQSAHQMHSECIKFLLQYDPDFKASNAAAWLHEIFTEEELTQRGERAPESPALIIQMEKSLIASRPYGRRDATWLAPKEKRVEKEDTLDGLSFLKGDEPQTTPHGKMGFKVSKIRVKPRTAAIATALVLMGGLGIWLMLSPQPKPQPVKREPTVRYGSVRIEVSPPGAMVAIDGTPYGNSSPVIIGRIEAGKDHLLRIERDQAASYLETFQVVPDEEKLIAVNLEEGIKESAFIVVSSEPKGARIFLDDVDTGFSSPAALKEVSPDTPHKIGLFLDGYQYAEQSISVPSGKTREVTARLTANWASLRIVTLPEGASVSINGKKLGPAPVRAETLAPGEAIQIVADLNGFETASRTVELKPGENRVIELVLSPEARRR